MLFLGPIEMLLKLWPPKVFRSDYLNGHEDSVMEILAMKHTLLHLNSLQKWAQFLKASLLSSLKDKATGACYVIFGSRYSVAKAGNFADHSYVTAS